MHVHVSYCAGHHLDVVVAPRHLTQCGGVGDDHAEALGGDDVHDEDEALGFHVRGGGVVVLVDGVEDDLGQQSHVHLEYHCHWPGGLGVLEDVVTVFALVDHHDGGAAHDVAKEGAPCHVDDEHGCRTVESPAWHCAVPLDGDHDRHALAVLTLSRSLYGLRRRSDAAQGCSRRPSHAPFAH